MAILCVLLLQFGFFHKKKNTRYPANAMSSASERQERRRVHSEEALDTVRLKNSRAGHLSRVTALVRATDVFLNDSKNDNEVAELNEFCFEN